MAHREPTEESFLKDVEKHEVRVLLDNGVYRHLQCKQPNSRNMWFDIVTWPGFLAYAGDMGAFTFTRLEDMFEFFRYDRSDGRYKINEQYWSEKLEAVDRNGHSGGYKEYSADKLRQFVEERVADWIKEAGLPYDCSEEDAEEFRGNLADEIKGEVQDEILSRLDDGEQEARRAVAEFSHSVDGYKYQFHDAWEWDCTVYTYRFTWCCYALVWAIKQYDTLKEAKKEGVTANG